MSPPVTNVHNSSPTAGGSTAAAAAGVEVGAGVRMNPPMKPLAPGPPLSVGLAAGLGNGVACRGVAVIGGGAGVGTGVGGAVGAAVGRGVAPEVTVTVGPAIVASLRSATAVNVTGQVPTGKLVVVPPNVPFVSVPEITPIWTVRPATDADTVAAKPS